MPAPTPSHTIPAHHPGIIRQRHTTRRKRQITVISPEITVICRFRLVGVASDYSSGNYNYTGNYTVKFQCPVISRNLVISPRETPGQTPSLGAYSSSCDAYHDPFVWACPFVIADLPRGNTHTGGTKATPVRAQPQPSAGCTQSALATAAASVPLAAARRGSLVIVSPRPVHVRQASLAKAQRGGAVPVDTSWRGLLACSSAMLGHAAQPCGESCRHLPVLHGGPARLRITWR